MSTIQTDIETALFDRVKTLELSPEFEIAWPNIAFVPVENFVRVSHAPNQNARVLINSEPHHRYGLLQLSVFTAKDSDTTLSTEICGKIEQHFPADLVLSSGNARVRLTKAPDLVPAFAEDTHWHAPVMISYECYA